MPIRLSVAATVIARWLKANRLRLLALFGCVLVPLFLFGELAEEVSDKEPLAFDEAILLMMHSHASPTLDRVMLLASALGSGAWVAPRPGRCSRSGFPWRRIARFARPSSAG